MAGTLSDQPSEIDFGTTAPPVIFRRSPRAKRLALRIDARERTVIVVLPRRTDPAEGAAFAAKHSRWIERRWRELAPAVAFAEGAIVPFLGEPLVVARSVDGSGPVRIENHAIVIGGRVEHLPRRLKDWLKAEAKTRLSQKCRALAAMVDRQIERITVRELRSRWGSAQSNRDAGGRLSFSWRLILAPEFVLDYLAAHEVAHLVHANHGKAFWALTQSLCPEASAARSWLRRSGADLHRYG
jgi:predicted metal-dependent hydrolase